MVITVVLAGAVAAETRVSVLVVTPAASVAGEKVAVTPVGSGVTASATAPVNPPVRVSVTTRVCVAPGATVSVQARS